jgi:hypothetical protein
VPGPCRARGIAPFRRRAGHDPNLAASVSSPRSFPSNPADPAGPHGPRRGACCPGAVSPHYRRDLPASPPLWGFSPSTWLWTLKPRGFLALHTLDHTRDWLRPIHWISCGPPLLCRRNFMTTPQRAAEDPGGIPCAAPRRQPRGLQPAYSCLRGSHLSTKSRHTAP